MTWTGFKDMHSGGGSKEPHEHIYIEAPEAEAKVIFYNRFGHSPDRVTCTCCGPDYSVYEHESFAQATGFERGCKSLDTPRDPETKRFKQPDDPWFNAHYWLEPEDEDEARKRGWTVDKPFALGGEYRTVEEYERAADVLVIRADEVKDDEREGNVPEEGYVWVG